VHIACLPGDVHNSKRGLKIETLSDGEKIDLCGVVCWSRMRSKIENVHISHCRLCIYWWKMESDFSSVHQRTLPQERKLPFRSVMIIENGDYTCSICWKFLIDNLLEGSISK
jgi:hypothetical protein